MSIHNGRIIKNKSMKKLKYLKRFLRVFSRHPSHDVLRKNILLPKLTLLRLGSTTVSSLKYDCEINSIEGVRNSSSKLLMKQCFTTAGVNTAKWMPASDMTSTGKEEGEEYVRNTNSTLYFPIIAKSHFGSRGTGNVKLNTIAELESWKAGKNLSLYILEQYLNYSLEFRLHIAKNIGCFYSCRKALKKDCINDKAWQRHDDNCVWFIESNPDFRKPNSWDKIVEDCMKAIDAVGLDTGAFDVRVQSEVTLKGEKRDFQQFALIEINSAPSLAEITAQKYMEIIPKIFELKNKN